MKLSDENIDKLFENMSPEAAREVANQNSPGSRSEQRKIKLIAEMMDYVKEHDIELYTTLRDYANEHNPEWAQVLRNPNCRRSLFEYIKSRNRVKKKKQV